MKRYGSRARYLRWVVAACCLLGLSLAQTVMAQEGEPLTIKELLARHQATVDKIKTFRYDVEWVTHTEGEGSQSIYTVTGSVYSDHKRYLGDAVILHQMGEGRNQDSRRVVAIVGSEYLYLNYPLGGDLPNAARLSIIDMEKAGEAHPGS